jgi:hypothetical protein
LKQLPQPVPVVLAGAVWPSWIVVTADAPPPDERTATLTNASAEASRSTGCIAAPEYHGPALVASIGALAYEIASVLGPDVGCKARRRNGREHNIGLIRPRHGFVPIGPIRIWLGDDAGR